MNDASIGWIAAIIIGGLAGWIASGLMKTDTGIFLNVVLGIIGAAMLILGPVAWGLIKHAHGRRAFLHVPLGRRQGLQHHETVGAPPTDPGS